MLLDVFVEVFLELHLLTDIVVLFLPTIIWPGYYLRVFKTNTTSLSSVFISIVYLIFVFNNIVYLYYNIKKMLTFRLRACNIDEMCTIENVWASY